MRISLGDGYYQFFVCRCFRLLRALFLAFIRATSRLDMNRPWAFASRRMPLICTVLWNRRNKESCVSPSCRWTSNDITPQNKTSVIGWFWLCDSNRYSRPVYHYEVRRAPQCLCHTQSTLWGTSGVRAYSRSYHSHNCCHCFRIAVLF